MKKLGIVNSSPMNCSYGGVAPFIRNMHEDLSKVFDVHYFYIPESWSKFKIPGRIKILVYLILHARKLKECDFILSHIPEGSWFVGHLGIPYAHIYHGNSNPMTISKWKSGKLFVKIFDYFYKYINKNCPLIYSVGPAMGRIKKLFNPIDQNVTPLPYCQRKGLIFAGRLDKVKNINRLIDIYSKLPQNLRNNLPFYIAGFGPLEQTLKEQVYSLGLDRQIIFLGKIDNKDILKIDASKQILVMASSTEGFPTAIAEAFSVGIPIISTSVGDIPNIVKTGIQGILLPLNYNDEDYITAILTILDKYDHFATEAYKTAQLFDKHSVTETVIKDIQRILNSN